METFFWSVGFGYDPMTFMINRDELYGEENGSVRALIGYGTGF